MSRLYFTLLLGLAALPASPADTLHFSVVPRVVLYFKPSLESSPVGDEGFGAPFFVVDKFGSWEKVYSKSGTLGWIEMGFLASERVFRADYGYIALDTAFLNSFRRRFQSEPGIRWRRARAGGAGESAASAPAAERGRVTRPAVNLRALPNLNARVLFKAGEGQWLRVREVRGEWFLVEYLPGQTGWISGQYFSFEALPAQPPKGRRLASVEKSGANLRDKPSFNARILFVIKPEALVEITGKTGDWYSVKSEAGDTGYISSRKLSPPLLRETAPGGLIAGYVNRSGVRLREGPGENFPVLRSALSGELFEVSETQGEWYSVVMDDGSKAWIYWSFLSGPEEMDRIIKAKPEKLQIPIQSVKTLRSGVEVGVLREGPALDAPKAGGVFPEDTLFASEIFGNWVKVFVKGGGEGWIYGPILKTELSASAYYHDSVVTPGLFQGKGRPDAASGQTEARLSAYEANQKSLTEKLKTEMSEEEGRLSGERQRLAKEKKSLDDQRLALLKENEKRKGAWDKEREKLASERAAGLEKLQAGQQRRLAEERNAWQAESLRLSAFRSEVEEKSRAREKSIQEKESALTVRQEEIKKAEEDLKKLKAQERTLSDEDFFFDESATSTLEAGMDRSEKEKKEIEQKLAAILKTLEDERLAFQSERRAFEERLSRKIHDVDSLKNSLARRAREGEAELAREKARSDSLAFAREKSFAEEVDTLMQRNLAALRRKGDEVEAEERRHGENLKAFEAKYLDRERELRARMEGEKALYMAEMEKHMLSQRAASSEEADRRVAGERARIDERESTLRQKELALKAEAEKKAAKVKEEQAAWLLSRQAAIDSLQKTKEKAISLRQSELDRQRSDMEALNSQMEERNRSAKAEISRMQASLDDQIRKFEEAKKAATELKKREETMADEDFFFNDDATADLEKKMDATDSLRKAAEAQVSREKETLTTQRAGLEKAQRELELKLSEQEKKLESARQSLEGERQAVEKLLSEKKERMALEERARRDSLDHRLKLQEEESRRKLSKEAAALDSLRSGLAARQRAVEDSLRRAGASAQASQQQSFEREKRAVEEERRKVDSLKTAAEAQAARKLAAAEKALSDREALAKRKLEEDREAVLQSMEADRKKVETERQAMASRQAAFDKEREEKESRWRTGQEAWMDEKKKEIGRLQSEQDMKLKSKESELENKRLSVENLGRDIEEKNKKTQEELTRMRAALEAEMQKFEEAKKRETVLKSEEKKLDDEDFFFDNSATDKLENEMDKVDSLKKAVEKQMAAEKGRMELEKAEAEKAQSELNRKLEEEQKKLEESRQAMERQRKSLEEALTQKTRSLELESKKREDEFSQKLKLAELEQEKRKSEEEKGLESRRRAVDDRQKFLEDSLRRAEGALRQKMEEERSSFRETLQAEARRQTDSLSRASEEARQLLARERGKMEAGQKSVEEQLTQLEEERKKLRAEREAFEAEKRKFETASAPPAPGGFDEFLTSVADAAQSLRSFDEVNLVLSPKIGEVMSLYHKLQKKDKALRGKMVFNFIILPSGAIGELKILENTLKNKALEEKALKLIQSCKFDPVDPASKSIRVAYPMIFVPR